MIRRTQPGRVSAVVASLCLLASSLSAQVHIREKIQIQPTAPPVSLAEVSANDNLRFVFEWTPTRILGRMFVTGLDNDFNTVVDTFLTDVGGHLEVISPAVEGEYTFNLQIRTAELLPGEEETLKLSIYLNETLLREDTDFSYSFTGVFSVWIPESFIYFADPLHHFSLQLNPIPPSYGESSTLTVIARDASDNEIALPPSKTLTLRVVPEDFLSFITTAGDTAGFEMPGIPYNAARAGTIRVIGYGPVPAASPVSAIVSADLEENTTKTGQLEFDVNIPCVTTNLSSATARPRDTIAVNFSYTKTDGTVGAFLPDQQFSVFIADNDSLGLLYSADGQSGPNLFGAVQPISYVAPDSLSTDSIVVQFLVEPVVTGGAAAAAASGEPTMGKRTAGARVKRGAFQMFALSGCTVAQLVVEAEEVDHFEVRVNPDTVAHNDAAIVMAIARDRQGNEVNLADDVLVNVLLDQNGQKYGDLAAVEASGPLVELTYGEIRSGKLQYKANKENPEADEPQTIGISVVSSDDEGKEGIGTAVVKHSVEKFCQNKSQWAGTKYDEYVREKKDGSGDSTDAQGNKVYHTVSSKGCALTCMAMVAKEGGADTDPGKLADNMRDNNGFDDHGVKWGAIDRLTGYSGFRTPIASPDPGLRYKKVDGKRRVDLAKSKSIQLSKMDAYLLNNALIVAQVYNPTTGNEHWVVVTKKEGDTYKILDPGCYEGRDDITAYTGNVYRFIVYRRR